MILFYIITIRSLIVQSSYCELGIPILTLQIPRWFSENFIIDHFMVWRILVIVDSLVWYRNFHLSVAVVTDDKSLRLNRLTMYWNLSTKHKVDFPYLWNHIFPVLKSFSKQYMLDVWWFMVTTKSKSCCTVA